MKKKDSVVFRDSSEILLENEPEPKPKRKSIFGFVKKKKDKTGSGENNTSKKKESKESKKTKNTAKEESPRSIRIHKSTSMKNVKDMIIFVDEKDKLSSNVDPKKIDNLSKLDKFVMTSKIRKSSISKVKSATMDVPETTKHEMKIVKENNFGGETPSPTYSMFSGATELTYDEEYDDEEEAYEGENYAFSKFALASQKSKQSYEKLRKIEELEKKPNTRKIKSLKYTSGFDLLDLACKIYKKPPRKSNEEVYLPSSDNKKRKELVSTLNGIFLTTQKKYSKKKKESTNLSNQMGTQSNGSLNQILNNNSSINNNLNSGGNTSANQNVSNNSQNPFPNLNLIFSNSQNSLNNINNSNNQLTVSSNPNVTITLENFREVLRRSPRNFNRPIKKLQQDAADLSNPHRERDKLIYLSTLILEDENQPFHFSRKFKTLFASDVEKLFNLKGKKKKSSQIDKKKNSLLDNKIELSLRTKSVITVIEEVNTLFILLLFLFLFLFYFVFIYFILFLFIYLILFFFCFFTLLYFILFLYYFYFFFFYFYFFIFYFLFYFYLSIFYFIFFYDRYWQTKVFHFVMR